MRIVLPRLFAAALAGLLVAVPPAPAVIIKLVPLKEVQPLTGYIRGGVTALAGKRDYPVFVDETAELFDLISISAGVRGAQILLAPSDYLAAVHGVVGAIARSKTPP